MRYSFPPHLRGYVEPTQYCDATHPAIIAQAEALAEPGDPPVAAARAVYSFVRDHYAFGFTMIDEKASDTLHGTLGWCVTKTNLQVALLRALGIPARFHMVALTKRSLKGLVSGLLYRMLSEPIDFHPWCECYLDGRWVASDLFIDQTTYEAAIATGLYSRDDIPSLDWNGHDDLLLVRHWMRADHGTRQSYDEIVARVLKDFALIPPFLMRLILRHSNRRTARLREVYAPLPAAEEEVVVS
jgi:transglutaminase-like putative cysteine protease